MKRLLLVVVLALAICGAGVAPAGAQAANTAPPDKATLEKVMAAWSTLDPAKAAPFYAKDANLIFYDLAPRKYVGWAAYDKGVRDVFSTMKSLSLKVLNDAEVHTVGNLAWTTATVDADLVNKDGSRDTLATRWTSVWEKRGNNWLIVHEHVSAPLPDAPAPSTAKPAAPATKK